MRAGNLIVLFIAAILHFNVTLNRNSDPSIGATEMDHMQSRMLEIRN